MEYTKDECVERQPGPRRSPDERSDRGSATRSAATTRRRRRPARTATAASSAAARSPTAAAAGATCRGSSTRRATSARSRARGLADWPITLRGARAVLHAGRVGDGHLRPARQLAVRRADVEGLSGAAGAAEGVGRAVQDRRRRSSGSTVVPGPLAIITQPYMGRAACVNCGMCSGFGCHVQRALELGGHDAAARGRRPATAKSGVQLRARDLGRQQRPRDRRRSTSTRTRREVFQKAKAVVLSANGSRVGAPAAALEVGAVPRRPRELERRRRQVSDARQRRERERALRASAERLQGRRSPAPASSTSCRPIRSAASTAAAGMTARGFDTPISYGLARPVSPAAPRWGAALQEGAARGSQPQDDDHLLRHAAAARDQSRRSRSGREGRVGPAGDAHHVDEPSRRHQEHGVLHAEVGRDSRGGRRQRRSGPHR